MLANETAFADDTVFAVDTVIADHTSFADTVFADDTVIVDDEVFVDDTVLLAVMLLFVSGSSLPTGNVTAMGVSLLLTGASPPAPVATSL